jgi:hypothetical protein
MLNGAAGLRRCVAVWLLGVAVLCAAAWCRGAEYDEQYTLFLTAGVPRPAWPQGVFAAGLVRQMQAGHASLAQVARDLRRTDVHPPLYFWAAELWRRRVGPGLFGVRLLSVGCSLGALALVGVLARQAGVPPALAMLLALGSYGFVYTGCVARGFALAQALNLGGLVCTLAVVPRREAGGSAGGSAIASAFAAAPASRTAGTGFGSACALAAGLLFGAASTSNYLAVFVGLAALAWLRGRHALLAAAGMLPFLAVDAWFFAAQHGSRPEQFPSFALTAALPRLARYAAANLFGGLPLYVPEGLLRTGVALVLAALLVGLTGLAIAHWRQRPDPAGRLLGGSALAQPLGLLALGLVFDTTPVELRYLVFAVPPVAVLLAGALATRPALLRRGVLALQAAAILGLLLRPETMQPARATAASVAAVTAGRDSVVLLPYGNDGVGIVGAFGIEVPPTQRLLLVRGPVAPNPLRDRVGTVPVVLVAPLTQDASSRTAIPALLGVLSGACWRRLGETPVPAFRPVCRGT